MVYDEVDLTKFYVVSLLSPVTYTASARRHVVLAMSDRIPLAVDMVVLVAFMVGLLWVAGRRMDCRQR